MGGRGASSASGKTLTILERSRHQAERDIGNFDDAYFDQLDMRVPEFVYDKLTSNERYAVEASGGPVSVRRETEKAVLLSVGTDYGNVTVWSPKSVFKTHEQARQSAIESAVRRQVNDRYTSYLVNLGKANGVKLGRTRGWDKVKKKLDTANVKYLDRDSFANTREDKV